MPKFFRFSEGGDNYYGTLKELSESLGVSVTKLRRMSDNDNIDASLEWIGMKLDVYAFYDGEIPIAIGTIYELGEKLGMDPKAIKYYSYPSVQERIPSLHSIKIEDEFVIVDLDGDEFIEREDKKMTKEEKWVIGGEVKEVKPKFSSYGHSLYRGCFRKW